MWSADFLGDFIRFDGSNDFVLRHRVAHTYAHISVPRLLNGHTALSCLLLCFHFLFEFSILLLKLFIGTKIEIAVPNLGDSVTEGTLEKWLKGM